MSKKKPSEIPLETPLNEPSDVSGDKSTSPPPKSPRFVKGLSTGSTLLNLACSGEPDIGFLQGCFTLIVGDSASGKSFISLTCLAEATQNEGFNDHRFIFDNAEDGALMDIEKFFGKKVLGRLEPPALDGDENPVYSSTIEELYYHIDDALDKDEPFIYILDSMDALDTDDDAEKFKEQKKASRNGKTVSGSYGTSKARANSAGLRRIISRLRKTESVLIFISQTRDNVGGFGYEKKTRSGGKALRFFATTEFWSSVKSKIKKKVLDKERHLGIIASIQMKKNRLDGNLPTIEIPISRFHGIDDTRSCIEYLIEEGHWSSTKQGFIEAKEFDETSRIDNLITLIEAEDKERELRQIVARVWKEIEAECRATRKKRY